MIAGEFGSRWILAGTPDWLGAVPKPERGPETARAPLLNLWISQNDWKHLGTPAAQNM